MNDQRCRCSFYDNNIKIIIIIKRDIVKVDDSQIFIYVRTYRVDRKDVENVNSFIKSNYG